MAFDTHKAAFKAELGGDKKTFELTPLDETYQQKLIGPGGEDMGTFYLEADLIDQIPTDALQVPDDGLKSIVFPVIISATAEAKICRYVGPLERAMAMFCAHKGGLPIIPMTDDLRRMVEVFDRHDGIDSSWMFKELELTDLFGKTALADIIGAALDQGFLKRKRGRLVRTEKELDKVEVKEMPKSFVKAVLPGKKL